MRYALDRHVRISCAMQTSMWKPPWLWRAEPCMWECGLDETEMLLVSIPKRLYSQQNVQSMIGTLNSETPGASQNTVLH